MNSLLLQMMASRAGSQGNPEMANLLARLCTPGADAGQISQEILAQLGDRNPAFNELAKQLAESRRQKVIDLEATEVQDTPAPTFDASAICELQDCANRLLSEVQVLRERVDQLAAALGACCLCWGQDANCRICRGRGAPGFAMPDEALFECYVLPAVILLRDRKSRQQKESPKVNQIGA